MHLILKIFIYEIIVRTHKWVHTRLVLEKGSERCKWRRRWSVVFIETRN